MRKHLFFVCPTDYLEPVIEFHYGPEIYFLSSLGNSMSFDQEKVSEVLELLKGKHIHHIAFVLTDDNRMISDALGDKDYASISGLNKFYRNLARQQQSCFGMWPTCYHQFLISSYYLNHKMKELRLALSEQLCDQIVMSAKIYKRKEQVFRDIYPISMLRNCTNMN